MWSISIAWALQISGLLSYYQSNFFFAAMWSMLLNIVFWSYYTENVNKAVPNPDF